MWKNFGSRFNYSSRSEVAYYLDRDIMNYVLLYDDGRTRETKIYRDCINVDIGEAEKMYMFLGASAACAGDGHFHVALHPVDAETEPALFSDNEIKRYGFNGYFTSVSLW